MKTSLSPSRWQRRAVAAAAGLLVTTTLLAQSSEGSLFGVAGSGASVTITNIETGTSRQIRADRDGSFNFSRLPPGRYRVSSGNVTREVSVAIGSGTQVSLTAAERVEVTGARVRSVIDVSTVESNSVFTQEQIQALPVPRSVDAVALLAPGVVRGDSGLGSGTLPSFGGASVAENGYYINGFDVTNIRNFLSYAQLPFDAISQQQVKTGGYGAEYGRSLGGVVSLVTKRGTNEWKFGVSAYMTPSSLREPGKDVLDKEPTRAGLYYLFQSADKVQGESYNIYGGGPLIKDKLFIFALVEGRNDRSTLFGQSQATVITNRKPNGMVKLDFTPTDKHSIELTAIENKSQRGIVDYTNARPYSTSLDGAGAVSESNGGGDVTILKYTGYLTDKLTVSALTGRVNDLRPVISGARTAGADCPTVLDVDFSDLLGCWVPPWPGAGGRDPLAPPDKDTRDAFRVDLEYAWGSHTIRAGVDQQKFVSAEAGGSPFSGGQYWKYNIAPSAGVNVRGQFLPGGTKYARLRTYNTTSGSFSVENSAFYVEDSWNVSKNLLLYAGLRSESFENKNSEGRSFVKRENLLAPRLGGSWNVNGDSSLKVYANAGRYFIPVASNTNIRMTRAEEYKETFYTYDGIDARTKAPLNIKQVGDTRFILDGRLPDPGTVSDTQLKPMNQDEFILGFQRAAKSGFVYGVKAITRKINAGMDDYCDHTRVAAWIKANVNPQYVDTLAPCMLMNPGQDLNIKVDLNGDGKLVDQKIPASVLGLAPYTRTYNAVEFTLERPNDGRWGMQASYTYSKSKGTAEGYVQSQLNQEDAGVTQDFDFGSFTDGANGYLPNDRRHVIKVFGNLSLNKEFRVGMNFTMASGRPLSCVGFVPPSVPDYAGAGAYTSASSYYCLQSTTEGSKLVQRGSVGRTPWTNQLDLQLAYQPAWARNKLTLQMDVFNLLNNQEVIEQSEVRDYSRATSISAPYQLSANYGQPTAFQTPRYVRLSARYNF